MTDLERVRSKKWHTVRNAKRAKELRNRGEDIKWSCELGCYIWHFARRTIKASYY